MYKIHIKSVVLIVLVFLSIYQTALLWFDYPSNRNFLYPFIREEQNEMIEKKAAQKEAFFPEKVSIFYGDKENTYDIMSLSKSDSLNLVDDSLQVIIDTFSSGVEDKDQIQVAELWERPHILFEMPYTLTYDVFKDELGMKSKWMKKTFLFDRIYIFPELESEEGQGGYNGMRIAFADSTLENLFSVNVQDERINLVNDSLVFFMNAMETEENSRYFSSKEAGLEHIENDVLIPVRGQVFDLLSPLYGDWHFYEGGVRDEEQLSRFFSYFFVNPKNTWKTITEDVVRYGDLESVVRYTKSGLFEYRLNSEFIARETSLLQSLHVANDFLGKDRWLNQLEYSLEKIEAKGNQVVLYYMYKYRNVPLEFTDLTDYNMMYPMEIVVSGNTVTQYRRLMWKSQEVVVQGKAFKAQYQEALDEGMKQNNLETIENIYLGYRVEHFMDGAFLTWVLEKDGRRYYVELE